MSRSHRKSSPYPTFIAFVSLFLICLGVIAFGLSQVTAPARAAIPTKIGTPFTMCTPATCTPMDNVRDVLEAKAAIRLVSDPTPVWPKTYIVVGGDYLSEIAGKEYNNQADWPFIYKASNLSSTTIYPNQKLTVPDPTGPIPTINLPTPAVSRTVAATGPSPTASSGGSYGAPAGSFEACVIARESGGNPTAYNSSSGASGLFGFLLSTWLSTGVGYPGGAYTAPPSVQIQAFDIEYARSGTSPWAPYDGC